MKCLAGVLVLGAVVGLCYGEPGEGEDVVTITAENFDEEVKGTEGLVLVEFYAPWCGHCKSLAPEWAKAATALKGKVKIAAVDATQYGDLAKMFDVSGYPTIITFPHGKKEDEEGIIIEQYTGGRDADGIIEYAATQLEKVGIDISTIDEVVSKASIESCLGKKYCAVFSLPHVIDSGADGRNSYIDTIKELVRTMGRGNPCGYVWLQAGNQEGFESTFQAATYPGMTVINAERNRYVNHIGAFTVNSLAKTIRSLQTGRLGANKYTTFPEMEKTEPWDGKEYTAPEEEDDY
eukprot:TRINITY_DN43849_c0_g1_i1.p1 TRINITY_DN43849_c0_g1~~TRINITY_DN43849_c0_g1_i1.p1  ORF type:complete len:292 (+),score=64.26 TRINITY_DN43849_c0_g1_i1:77-952(+)